MPDPTDSRGPDSRGRRANGLPATDWGALVDLDPRLSEGLLDRLAEAGVAAYVEPATAVDTVHRAVTMPPRPLDRLWVDPSRADSARAVVASEVADLTALLAEDDPGATAHGLVHPVPRSAAPRVLAPPALPGPSAVTPATPATPEPAEEVTPPPAPSDDDVFADLVARFHAPTGPGGWPAAEDVPPPTLPPAPPAPPPPTRPLGGLPPRPGPPLRRRSDPPPPADGPAPGDELPGWLDPDDDDGHFVPPPPPPVPRIRLRTLAAVLAVVLGLVVLFAPQLLHLTATYGVGVLGLVLLAGGATALVWSVHDSHEGPDDGAVV